MIPPPDLLDDGVRVSGPDDRPRAAVVLLDEAVERLLQRDQAGEAVAPEAPPRSTSAEIERDLTIKALAQRLLKAGAITLDDLEEPAP